MSAPYIAATVPAKIVRVSQTTLFRIAMRQFGDPLQWPSIALLNGLIDPWVNGQAEIEVPPVIPSGTQTGVLAPTIGGATAGI